MKDRSNPITACLVVYNEEAIIGRCLESLVDVVKRIVVVHDGPCTDRTLDICREYGCDVFEKPHVGMCEGHRVFTFEQVQTPWILLIDADEYLSDELKVSIPELIADESVSAYDFYWPYWDGTGPRSTTWPLKRALFLKDRFHYLAFPHAAVEVEGQSRVIPMAIEHRPLYDNYSAEAFRKKHKKWIGIHADYFLKDWSILPRYPKDREDLRPHYAVLKNWPRLFAPILFAYHFAGLICLGGWKGGRIGFRNAYYQALYYFKVGMEIAKLKKSRS